MSDYARVHDFSVKDGLTTGDPNKVIRGSEVDAEFDAIVTMSATKIDEPAGPTDGNVLTFSSGAWTAGASPMPTGGIIPYAGSSAPTGWLICDGSSVSTTTYAALFAVVAYTYGGSGANFNLPDLTGRVVAGKEAAETRLTTAGSGINGGTLGAAGGTETHILTEAQIPAHTHNYNQNANATVGDPGSTASSGNQSGATTGSTGGGGAHLNTQPTIVLNYIIKT